MKVIATINRGEENYHFLSEEKEVKSEYRIMELGNQKRNLLISNSIEEALSYWTNLIWMGSTERQFLIPRKWD